MAKIQPPPARTNQLDSPQWKDWLYSIYGLITASGGTLGTMASQNANSVAITGGSIGGVGITGSTINSTPIGVTSPNRVNTNALKTTALTGYLYGNSSSDVTASTTIPYTNITGVPAFISPKYGSFHAYLQTTLSTAIPNGTSTSNITVASTTGFPSSGAFFIDNEIIIYTGTTSTTFTGITRSNYGTPGASHSVGAVITDVQTAPALTATKVLINSTDFSNGVTLNSSSQITIANAGLYNLQFSLQATSSYTSPADNITVWFKLNGSDVTLSAGVTTVPVAHASKDGVIIISWNEYFQFAANDYIEMYWHTDNGNSVLRSYPVSTSPVHPAAPIVAISINQIA